MSKVIVNKSLSEVWVHYPQVGENNLGKLIMKIRDDLQAKLVTDDQQEN
jgi:predicted NAD-dependent protein-ADP-ribosyltransferase YbiA (DUF1768 family)